jgi:ethanolamine utilization protein EutN
MRISEVIGTVTLNRAHPSFAAASLRLAVPLALSDLNGQTRPQADSIVVYDELGAGVGAWIAVSEGREAAQPFGTDTKPVDAYNGAILDSVQLEMPSEGK